MGLKPFWHWRGGEMPRSFICSGSPPPKYYCPKMQLFKRLYFATVSARVFCSESRSLYCHFGSILFIFLSILKDYEANVCFRTGFCKERSQRASCGERPLPRTKSKVPGMKTVSMCRHCCQFSEMLSQRLLFGVHMRTWTLLSGKGPNIWDTFTHVGSHIENNDTGDIACDSYHKLKEDVKLIKKLGVSVRETWLVLDESKTHPCEKCLEKLFCHYSTKSKSCPFSYSRTKQNN